MEYLDGWREREKEKERGREREMVRDLIRFTLWQSKGEPISPFYYSFCLLLSNFSSLLRNSFQRFFLSNLFLSFYLSQILSLSLLCYFFFIKIYHFPFSTYFFLLSIKTNCFSRTNKFYLLNFEGRNEKKKQKKVFSLRTKKVVWLKTVY